VKLWKWFVKPPKKAEPAPRGIVSIKVREVPCRDHPSEEWLTISVDGHIIMECCTGALKAYSRNLRGKDLIQWR